MNIFHIAYMLLNNIAIWTNIRTPDSKVHGANMGLTWFLSAPDGPHFGPMNLAIRDGYRISDDLQ